MAKYQLIGGQHEQFGKTYKKGDVIDTPIDLCKLFRGKFQRVITEGGSPVAVQLVQPQGKAPASPEKPPAPSTPKEDGAPKTSEKAGSGATKDVRGRNATEHFPQAVDDDFAVFKKNRVYFVYDVDDPDIALNKDGLKKAEVGPFIQKHLEG